MDANERRGSEVSHVLFREEDGWTSDEARRWLHDHDFERYDDVEIIESEGGEKLKPGNYLGYKVVPSTKKFTSYGYSDEMADGIWFKFAGFRPRGASERKGSSEDLNKALWNLSAEVADAILYKSGREGPRRTFVFYLPGGLDLQAATEDVEVPHPWEVITAESVPLDRSRDGIKFWVYERLGRLPILPSDDAELDARVEEINAAHEDA